MKTLTAVTFLAALAIMPAVHAQKGTLVFPKAPDTNPPPPKVWESPVPPTLPAAAPQKPAAQPGQVYVYDQKPMAGRPVLVTEEQAQTIINHFKENYAKLGSPRLLIYVNRELVDEKSGMKLIKRDEHVVSTHGTNGNTVKTTGDNSYRADGKPEPTLADKQTVRDVERLFGRPLRAAGASLADQKVASELIADKPLDEFIGTTDTPQARKDREALAKITDAVIEILISSKNITAPTISGGDSTFPIPDIQATAIRLKDSKILGQVSSSDVTSRVPPASLANFDVREVAEATALALMEDITP